MTLVSLYDKTKQDLPGRKVDSDAKMEPPIQTLYFPEMAVQVREGRNNLSLRTSVLNPTRIPKTKWFIGYFREN